MSHQRLTGVFALGLLFVAPMRAQQDVCLHRSIPVNVLTQDGKIVTGLDAASFRGSYRHKPVRILSTTRDEQPRRILMLLDSSGSMTEHRDDWTVVLNIADAVVTHMPPQTPIGLAAFAVKIDRSVELTSNRQKLEQELTELRRGSKLFPKGPRKTALWDAIQSGLAMLGAPQEGDVIYVISDGEDNSSKTNPPVLERTLLSAGVRLFALELYDAEFADEIMEGSTGPQHLVDFVTTTGGLPLILPRNQQAYGYALADKSGKPTLLGRSLALQLQQITAFERLEIELPEPIDKPRDWDLKVTNLGEFKARNLTVVYPRKLLPCPASAGK